MIDYDAAARAAFTAHQKAVGGSYRIAWDDLSDGDREIWTVVAEAVLLQARRGVHINGGSNIQIGDGNQQSNRADLRLWP